MKNFNLKVIEIICIIMFNKSATSGEIYCLTSPSNKKYIGQARTYLSCGRSWGTMGRWNNHIIKAFQDPSCNAGRCRALDAAIRKYGANSFKVETIFICDESELNRYETYYIKIYNTLAPNGYNLDEGGASGRWSDESRRFMSEKMKLLGGHPQNDETRKKISSTLKQNWGATIAQRNRAKKGVPQSKQPRKDPDDVNLPKYISSKKNNGVKTGYCVIGHPSQNGKSKSFMSLSITMDDKLKLAIKYLEQL